MKEAVSVVIFEGGHPVGAVEKMFTGVRHAVLLDNIAKMQQVQEIGSVYLLTNYAELAREAARMGVVVRENNLKPQQFHFGRILQVIINEEKLENVLYMGGASIPLVTEAELAGICRSLLSSSAVIYANNAQSADIIAFKPGNLLNAIAPPPVDNILAVALRDGSGVEMLLFPNTTGLLFDLDTPADLLILAGSPLVGPRARRSLRDLPLDLTTLERAKAVLGGDYEEAILLGRVGAPLIAHINKNLKLRLRIFSEERGMKALGREESGLAVSLMGYFLEEVGPRRFFQYCEKVAQCAFMDTRVLMVHLKINPDTEERFRADLGLWQELRHPLLREFTRAAAECSIPVICGGHSLVLGGLWALVDEIGPTY
ncbi:MAG: hypothetical protein AB1796_00420 [Bacillota bacterium]